MSLPLAKPASERPRFGQPGYDMAADLEALQVQLQAANGGNRLIGLVVTADDGGDDEDCEPSADELFRTECTWSVG